MNDSTVCAGRLRTKSASDCTNAGFSTYVSGVRHQGNILDITVSATFPDALAVSCQPSSTVRTKLSVFVHPPSIDNDLTLFGYFAATHNPIPAPSDIPNKWAFSIPNTFIKSTTSSA